MAQMDENSDLFGLRPRFEDWMGQEIQDHFQKTHPKLIPLFESLILKGVDVAKFDEYMKTKFGDVFTELTRHRPNDPLSV
jgi:hypothetical protein